MYKTKENNLFSCIAVLLQYMQIPAILSFIHSFIHFYSSSKAHKTAEIDQNNDIKHTNLKT